MTRREFITRFGAAALDSQRRRASYVDRNLGIRP